MKFGSTPLDEALGAILAHSLPVGQTSIKKGRVLTEFDVHVLLSAGYTEVVTARLEDGDIDENQAAKTIAEALAGPGIRISKSITGRCNLLADCRGLIMIDESSFQTLNHLHESVTVASAKPFATLEPGQMVATVKIIPFAIQLTLLEECTELLQATEAIIRVAPFSQQNVGLVLASFPNTKAKLQQKMERSINERLTRLDCSPAIVAEAHHDTDSVSDAIGGLHQIGCDVILISGATATVDRRDVVPSAMERAGGFVKHFGMPVDPGNLTVLGNLDDAKLIGLPGCARSPKLNGLDCILERTVANVDVTSSHIMDMGFGGLLKEIPDRPATRSQAVEQSTVPSTQAPVVAAVVLAAGRSVRMGPDNKLLADVDGIPMITRVVSSAISSSAEPVIVVTGHEHERVTNALSSLTYTKSYNPDFGSGLSSSLHRGLAAIDDNVDGIIVCLGDMPLISADLIDRLIAAFSPTEGRDICVPVWQGKRGNPVVLSRRFFSEIQDIRGDVGAKPILASYPDAVHEVPIDEGSVLVDVDNSDALRSVQGMAIPRVAVRSG